MTWNKKNLQFALSVGLRPSTIVFAQIILRKTNGYKAKELTVDFKEVNREIGKHRIKGEYDRKTTKQAIAQLDELTHGWFTVVKSYTWSVKTILVRPVDFAIEQKSQSEGKAPKLNRGNAMYSNAMYSEEHKNRLALQQQQDISKLNSLLKKIGLNYTPDNLARLWRLADRSWSDIQTAIKYMLYSQSTMTDGIRKPMAWFMESMKYGWHKEFSLTYASIPLPSFSTVDQIADYVRDLILPDNPEVVT